MKKMNSWFLPTILFLVNFILRFFLISKGPYNVDCLVLAVQSQKTLQSGQFHYLQSHGYPLTSLMGTLFAGMASAFGIPDPVTAVNWMSIALSSLSVPLFYLFVKELLGYRSALIAAVIFGFSPIFLAVSVYGNSHTVFVFFLMCGLVFLAKYFNRPKINLLITAGIFLGMSGAARLQDFLLILVPLTLYFFSRREQNSESSPESAGCFIKSRDYLSFLLICALTVLVFYAPFLANHANIQARGSFTEFMKTELTNNFLGLFSPIVLKNLESILTNFSYIGLTASAAGILLLIKRSAPKGIFLLVWCVFPFLIYAQLDFSVSRFFLICTIPLAIAIGYLCNNYLAHSFWIKSAAVLTIFLTIAVPFQSILPIIKFRHDYALLPEFALWVKDVTEPGAVVVTKDEYPFIEYYSQRPVIYRPSEKDTISPEQLKNFTAQLDRLLMQGTPVYMTATALESYDVYHSFSNFMKSSYRLNLVGERLSEGWQKGDLIKWVGREKLYRIENK